MSTILGLLVIIIGGLLGMYLDETKKMTRPANFYLLGYLVGGLAYILLSL